MKTKFFSIVLGVGTVLLFTTKAAYAQIQAEQNVNLTMDLQPVLQLNMTTPDEVDFTFDNVASYAGGVVKYGATVLTVSSTVSWSLYAVGNSNTASAGTAAIPNVWDNPLDYGVTTAGGITSISLGALELHQTGINTSVGYPGGACPGTPDYSLPFQPVVDNAVSLPGQNNLFYEPSGTTSPYVSPAAGHKYIGGGPPTTSGDGIAGGSYLLQTGSTSAYYYTIDYRIVPGLPVIFPTNQGSAGNDDCASADPAAIVSPAFAQPGFYTMEVKYLLIESD